MSNSIIVSVTLAHMTRLGYRGLVRIALAAALFVGGTRAADAQTTTDQNTTEGQSSPAKPKWEFLVPAGMVIPTGAQRGVIERGNLTAAQLSYVVRPQLAITGMLGWARTYDIAYVGRTEKLDVFTYDLGAEVRAPRWIGGDAIAFRPFAGAGAGGRSYTYRNLDVDATHNLGAYVSGGGELGIRRIRLRLEVRDYVTGFTPLGGGGTADTHNDIVTMFGLGFGR